MSLLRNGFLGLAVFALAVPALAAESRVSIDRVEVEAKENFLRLHADVLDSKGAPVSSLTAGDASVVSNGPVPDTPANRAKYGKPMSRAGRMTQAAGN